MGGYTFEPWAETQWDSEATDTRLRQPVVWPTIDDKPLSMALNWSDRVIVPVSEAFLPFRSNPGDFIYHHTCRLANPDLEILDEITEKIELSPARQSICFGVQVNGIQTYGFGLESMASHISTLRQWMANDRIPGNWMPNRRDDRLRAGAYFQTQHGWHMLSVSGEVDTEAIELSIYTIRASKHRTDQKFDRIHEAVPAAPTCETVTMDPDYLTITFSAAGLPEGELQRASRFDSASYTNAVLGTNPTYRGVSGWDLSQYPAGMIDPICKTSALLYMMPRTENRLDASQVWPRELNIWNPLDDDILVVKGEATTSQFLPFLSENEDAQDSQPAAE